ncbi:hypothetical protein LIER_28077 [Lithospermum erythrorhizon]|uniref:Helitron helicase-like domain-containing protein n=1 Tax=Lithospermum erythrorhizon TaxID=34254 RepID=A0AAV3RGC2_LITER
MRLEFVGKNRKKFRQEQYQDSMALVQEFRRPDIFLTITCNPNWPEIKERLQPGEEAQNRPNLCVKSLKQS